MTLIKQDQIFISEDKGRIGTRELDLEYRPIHSYEKDIRELKQELAACRTEIKQKNYEIEQCNKVIEKDYKVKTVLMQTVEMQGEKIREMREKYEQG